MGDPSKFINIIIYYFYYLFLVLMVVVEVFIFFYTHKKHERGEKVNRADFGSKWLLIINYCLCIYLNFIMVSQLIPESVRMMILPGIISIIGLGMMLGGIVIRLVAVLTLKKAFTLSVQTTENQHLITTGIYRKVRNPAYTGSAISILGAALGLRNIWGILITLVFTMFVYSQRIKVEEKLLTKHFGKEFMDYKADTYRLFPYIY